MEKELDLILQEFDEGNMCLDTLKTKLLRLFSVVGQSEQLKCGNPNPPCMPNIKYGVLECCNCQWGE